MYIYYCWITAMLPSYQDDIIAGMVRKGYMVGPAAKDGAITTPIKDGRPSVLFAISVYKPEEVDANKIHEDAVTVLKEMQAHYYSVIVSLSSEATWAGSNINLPSKTPPIPPVNPPDKKMN